jgi:hypothetical protein
MTNDETGNFLDEVDIAPPMKCSGQCNSQLAPLYCPAQN